MVLVCDVVVVVVWCWCDGVWCVMVCGVEVVIHVVVCDVGVCPYLDGSGV